MTLHCWNLRRMLLALLTYQLVIVLFFHHHASFHQQQGEKSVTWTKSTINHLVNQEQAKKTKEAIQIETEKQHNDVAVFQDDDGLSTPQTSNGDEELNPEEEENNDDDYSIQAKRPSNIPRLFLNMTLWSTDPFILQYSTVMERYSRGTFVQLTVSKRLCSITKTTTRDNTPPTTTASVQQRTPPECPTKETCESRFWNEAGKCVVPKYVIDPEAFWEGLERLRIFVPEQQNATTTTHVHAINNSLPADNHDTSFLILTAWDMIAEAHTSVSRAYMSTRQCQNTKYHHRSSCPKKCDAKNNQYTWDITDGLCKPKIAPDDPLFLSKPWVGPCSCRKTCYTSDANALNSSWPWSSSSQSSHRDDFFGKERTEREKAKWDTTQRRCLKERWAMQPRTYFKESGACLNHQEESSSSFSYNKPSEFHLSCPIHASGLHHLYYIPNAKLIFCGIPKVGISEWIKLFRRTFGANDYLSTPYYKHDTSEFHMSNLPIDKAQALWNDPQWIKATIWRDPAERLLSAYLDKIVREGYTKKYFRIGNSQHTDDPYTLTFEEFVKLVTRSNYTDHHDRTGLHYRVDPHWRPQLFTCGMDHMLPLFDFVGSFDHLAEHTRLLLEQVGLWEPFGRNFSLSKTSPSSNASLSAFRRCMVPPPLEQFEGENLPNKVELVGFNQRPPMDSQHSSQHGTGSKQRKHEYYTPELYQLVRQAYSMDYAIWDEMQARLRSNPLDVPRGHDFLFVQRSCAAN